MESPHTHDGAATLEDEAPVREDDPDRIDGGFLVIHGIGDQRPGETLVTVADAITRASDHWLRFRASARRSWWDRLVLADDDGGEPRARVHTADLQPTTDEGSAECSIHVEDRDGQITRLLGTEAYWADAFHTPAYVELLRWSILVVPWAIVEHFLRRFEKIRELRTGPSRGLTKDEATGWPILREMAIGLFALLLAPVFVGLLGAAWVLSWIPFEATRSLSRQVISAMSVTLGDSYVLLGSPARAAAIVDRATRQALALHQRVPPDARVWIVAHSQGCAVARAVLLRLREQFGDERLCERFGLVTVGSGLRKLGALRTLDTHTNPVWLVLIFVLTSAFIGAATGLTWLQWGQWGYLASGIGGNLGILGVFVFTMARAQGETQPTQPDQWKDTLRGLVRLVVAVGVVASAITIAFGLFFERGASAQMLACTATLASTAAGGGLAASHLLIGWHSAHHPDPLDALTQLEWHDFFASHDPVPNGPMDLGPMRARWEPGTTERQTSTQVLNRGSLLADHTSYFANVEQVVLPIAHLLLGGRLIEDHEHEWFSEAVGRRTRFVADRRIGMWIALGCASLLVLVQADRVLGWVPLLPTSLSALVSPQHAAPILRIAVLAGAPIAALAVVFAAWRLELGLRVLLELRRQRLRWWRLTALTVGLVSAASLALIGLTPTPKAIAPLAVGDAPARLRALLAGPPPSPPDPDTAPSPNSGP